MPCTFRLGNVKTFLCLMFKNKNMQHSIASINKYLHNFQLESVGRLIHLGYFQRVSLGKEGGGVSNTSLTMSAYSEYEMFITERRRKTIFVEMFFFIVWFEYFNVKLSPLSPSYQSSCIRA